MVAEDADVGGGSEPDRMRMKIWQEASGHVVYDNQPGAGDDATAGTALRGGNVIVHTSGDNLLAAAHAPADQGGSLVAEHLVTVADAAVRFWEQSTVDPVLVSGLRDVSLQLANFDDHRLGVASSSTNIVWIDTDAAGIGWNLQWESSPYAPGVNLLTVVAHEFGHKLGLDDVDPRLAGQNIMSGVLSTDDSIWQHPWSLPIHVHRDAGSRLNSRVANRQLVDELVVDEEISDVVLAAFDRSHRQIQDDRSPYTAKPIDGRRVKGLERDEVWSEDWLGLEDSLVDALAVEWRPQRRFRTF